MQQVNSIITHNGVFHADEVVAIALLRILGVNCPVIRTRDAKIIEEGKKDASTFIIDVGTVLDHTNGNYDHHQDLDLPSAAGLIWEHFKNEICPNVLAQTFFTQFISAIDMVDTNRNNIHETLSTTLPQGFRTVSSIIAGFNSDNVFSDIAQQLAFDTAISFAIQIIENELRGASVKAKNESEYASRKVLKNNVAVFENFSTIWKEKGDHRFAVMPHKDGAQVLSFNTNVCIIPENAKEFEGFIFRHAAGFIATFTSIEYAVKFAETL